MSDNKAQERLAQEQKDEDELRKRLKSAKYDSRKKINESWAALKDIFGNDYLTNHYRSIVEESPWEHDKK